MPVSGWMGDYLLKKSDNMDWWKECVVENGKAVDEDCADLLKKSVNMGWWKGCDVKFDKADAHRSAEVHR
eukprot:8791802-Pyramimonas_sp.AAC.1